MNVIRRNHVISLLTIDGSTATNYDRFEEVWLDECGKVVYLAGKKNYTPLERVSIINSSSWLEDFLVDWEIENMAKPFSGRSVFSPKDIEAIDAEIIVVEEETKNPIKSQLEGLKGFIGKKSQQVKHFVKTMGDRFRSLVTVTLPGKN